MKNNKKDSRLMQAYVEKKKDKEEVNFKVSADFEKAIKKILTNNPKSTKNRPKK